MSEIRPLSLEELDTFTAITANAYPVAVEMEIAEFSSLLVGTVGFSSLYRYGLARISDERYVKAIDRAFAVEGKPICMTQF
jgi:predicted acetyltransferase